MLTGDTNYEQKSLSLIGPKRRKRGPVHLGRGLVSEISQRPPCPSVLDESVQLCGELFKIVHISPKVAIARRPAAIRFRQWQ
jgi:hypothetical protein